MAIISAGVIMNVITGVLFFAFAFHLGVNVSPPVVGSVQIGMPAWRAGLELGDRVTEINDRNVSSFSDIMRGVALTTGAVKIEGVRADGSRFRKHLVPEMTGTRRMIGIAPIQGLQVLDYPDEPVAPVFPGLAAAKAEPPFAPGDQIRKVDGVPLRDFRQLQDLLAERRAESVTFEVARPGRSEPVRIRVPPQPFRSLGLVMDIEPIVAIKEGSPAEQAGLQVGDKILRVNGRDVGQELNPLRLPDLFAASHGQNVKIEVKREVESGTTEEITLHVVPENRPGWIEKPFSPGVPLSIPAIGVAYHLIPTVLRI
ncbi:MAG TPA: PDZ domain-containing protein [Planctomycetaceae bacterium]|nr:PDZ domain-containing protein [Planctomycetaceae bacterium]